MLARALLWAAAALLAGGALAAESSNPITVYTHDLAATARGGAGDQLAARAAAEGVIRVIVGLNLSMQREDTLPAPAAAAQAARVAAAEDRVIDRIVGAADRSAVRWSFIPYLSLFVNAVQVRELLADPDVAVLEEDVPAPPTYEPNITIPHVDQVQAKGFSGSGYTIAILDTGVDKNHKMLKGKVVSEACYSTNNTTAGSTSFCPGGVAASTAAGSAAPCPPTIKGCEHGTHVAAIAAGWPVTVAGNQLTGVAKDANIFAINVFSRQSNCGSDPAPCTRSYATDQISALQRVYALRTTLKVIAVNMSLGSGKFASTCDASVPAETTAIANLRAAGIGITIAAGNNGFDGYISGPACISSAFAIGNSTNTDLAEAYSNNSSLVKVLAPGASIESAVPGGYKFLSGTSMSAPYVAGALAALKSASPTSTMALMLTALECGGKMIVHRETLDGGQKFLPPPRPRVDLLAALDFLKYPTNAVRRWDFNAAAEAYDWTPFFGTWAVGGGRYNQVPLSKYWVATSVASCDTSSTVDAGIFRADPDGQEPAWNTGVIVRANISYKDYTVSGYWMAYNRCHRKPSGACDGIPSDPRGQGSVWRLDNFNLATNSGQKTLLCYRAAPVIDGQNNVRVVIDGSNYTYSVNGVPICSFSDATYATGRDMIAGYNNGVGAGWMGLSAFAITSANAGTVEAPTDPRLDPMALAPQTIPPGMAPSGWAPATSGPPAMVAAER